MTRYTNGANFERRVADGLESDGYWTCRAAGSHGAADIVAIKIGQTLLVQVKKTNGLLPPRERAALFDLARRCGALPIVAYQPVPRKPIVYRLLTGIGPGDWQPFYLDEVAAQA